MLEPKSNSGTQGETKDRSYGPCQLNKKIYAIAIIKSKTRPTGCIKEACVISLTKRSIQFVEYIHETQKKPYTEAFLSGL